VEGLSSKELKWTRFDTLSQPMAVLHSRLIYRFFTAVRARNSGDGTLSSSNEGSS